MARCGCRARIADEIRLAAADTPQRRDACQTRSVKRDDEVLLPADLPGEWPGTGSIQADAAAPRGVLLLDLEPMMAALFEEWLAAPGRPVWHGTAGRGAVALVVTVLAFPRQGGSQHLAQLQRAWPGVPVIVLSPTLHAGVPPQGETARQLGAAAVLPTPVSRAALLAAVTRLVPD